MPKRRFADYRNPWVIYDWHQTVDISTNMVDPRKEEFANLFHIGPGNIESFSGRILDNVKKVKEEKLISGKFHFHVGDIIYGKINPHLGKYTLANVEGLASADAYILNTRNEVSQDFFFTILQSKDFYNYSVSVSSRTGMPKINRNELNQYQYYAPLLEEQQKIGNFFKHLDQMISLEQHKLEKTKALKSAYLAEMFPAEGERVPKRRFAGFSGEWEYRKFDEEIELFSGLTYSPKDVKDEGTFVLRSSNVKNGEIVDADNVYVNSEVVNSSNVRKGDIIVVVRNGSRSLIGKHARIKSEMSNTVIGAFMTGIRSRQPEFLNSLLDTREFKKEIDKNLGATINQITNGMFRNMIFLFPDIQEQKAIGEFFEKLDNRITNQQEKLNKLKAMKQAYLEEMFV